MKIARVSVAGTIEFAARCADQQPWTPLSALGIAASTTAEVIANTAEIRARLRSVPAVPVRTGAELHCPIVSPPKILAIGLNYLDHIKETGAVRPERPILFAKYPSSLNGPTGAVLLDPALTEQLDYEAELAVVIGRDGRRLTPANALEYVYGYAVANDVSARDWQRIDTQFSRSKSYDSFCPIGPWITTTDEVPDPQALEIRSFVNGERRQDSNTRQMLFSVVDLLVFLSATMTLSAGDVILTGTPPGVGLGFKPPVFLTEGDVVACEIEGLGRIENPIVADRT